MEASARNERVRVFGEGEKYFKGIFESSCDETHRLLKMRMTESTVAKGEITSKRLLIETAKALIRARALF